MTKAEFFKQLDRRLQILKEHEREDILGEYAQHIELKMENGLSEEEAIRDFGDLEELADEILDAYNVNPLYGKEERKQPLVNMEELGGRAGAAGRKLADWLKAGGRAVWRFLGYLAELLKSLAVVLWQYLCRMAAALKHGGLVLVHWLPFGDRVVTEDGEIVKDKELLEDGQREGRTGQTEEKSKVRERREKDMWNTVYKGGRTFGNWLGRLIYLCFRLFVLLFVLAPAAVGDCMALVGLGVLIVMVLQGYPLIGVTLMTFGALVCGVSFVWLVWNLVFGKKKVEVDKVWESENI
ncbi:MAG: DUF1700 domain-containing protein [Hungatella hathewayi]|nr:DUF1700 domain-containing protein [Hungatella hathewayi]